MGSVPSHVEGSYVMVTNDTSDTIYIKHGPETQEDEWAAIAATIVRVARSFSITGVEISNLLSVGSTFSVFG